MQYMVEERRDTHYQHDMNSKSTRPFPSQQLTHTESITQFVSFSFFDNVVVLKNTSFLVLVLVCLSLADARREDAVVRGSGAG